MIYDRFNERNLDNVLDGISATCKYLRFGYRNPIKEIELYNNDKAEDILNMIE